jgi:hypothetical protein
VPGYEASTWYGVGAPKGTPGAIIDKVNKEINAALADAKMKARLTDLGGTVLAGSPAEFGRFIADETEKWAKVVKFAAIHPPSSGAPPDEPRSPSMPPRWRAFAGLAQLEVGGRTRRRDAGVDRRCAACACMA